MTLDDLRRLNIRDVGNWPLLPKVGAPAAALPRDPRRRRCSSTGRTSTRRSSAAEQEEVKLKEQYVEKKAKAINFDLYVQQLSEIEQSFGALLKQLPNGREMDALLTDINQAASAAACSSSCSSRRAQETMAEFYAELPINIKITGNYHDMGAFASDIAQLPRIVTLNDVAISNDKGALDDGGRRQDLPLPRRGRDRQAAQGGEGRQGQGGKK